MEKTIKKVINKIKENLENIVKGIFVGILLLIAFSSKTFERWQLNTLIIGDFIIIGLIIILTFSLFFSELSVFGIFSVKNKIKNLENEITKTKVDLLSVNNNIAFNVMFPNYDENKIKQLTTTFAEQNNDKKQNDNFEDKVPADNKYLFDVRFLLENKVKNYCNSTREVPFVKLIDIIYKCEAIDLNIYEAIKQIIAICNKAINGQEISKEALDFVKNNINYILKCLDEAEQKMEKLNYCTCPRCKYTGHSLKSDQCPNCGFNYYDD